MARQGRARFAGTTCRRVCTIVVLPALLGIAPGHAAPPPGEPPGNGYGMRSRALRLRVPQDIQVEPVRLGELVASAAVPWSGDPGTAAINTHITRSIPTLWNLRVPPTIDEPVAVDVAYGLQGPDGQPDRLGCLGAPESAVDVVIEPVGPTLFQQGQGMGNRVLRGGVILHIDLAPATRSGAYTGVLTITLSQL